MATQKQIKKIHALKSRLNFSDEEYRSYLMTEGLVTSCKDLSERESEILIRKMELAAVAKGVWERYTKRKYEELGRREGMATPRQLRMIEGMWKEVSRMRTEEGRKRALRYFIKRITGKDSIKFLEQSDVEKLVQAIKNIKK